MLNQLATLTQKKLSRSSELLQCINLSGKTEYASLNHHQIKIRIRFFHPAFILAIIEQYTKKSTVPISTSRYTVVVLQFYPQENNY
jgi:hypothetical protein